MKDSRFIELLNLYVDQQLSAAEAAELEAEIQRNAARRATYQQYCRIQKGCTLLFEKERNRAPQHRRLAAALAEADRKVVAFPERRSFRWTPLATVGSLAAAACLALVFAVQDRRDESSLAATPAPTEVAVTVPSSAAAGKASGDTEAYSIPAVESRASLAAGSRRPEFYSVLATRRAPAADVQTTSLLADESAEHGTEYRSENWMKSVELLPIVNLSEQRLTLTPQQNGTPEIRVLRSPKPVTGQATEINAFEFQR
jgi:anti-sigma factor RsiW